LKRRTTPSVLLHRCRSDARADRAPADACISAPYARRPRRSSASNPACRVRQSAPGRRRQTRPQVCPFHADAPGLHVYPPAGEDGTASAADAEARSTTSRLPCSVQEHAVPTSSTCAVYSDRVSAERPNAPCESAGSEGRCCADGTGLGRRQRCCRARRNGGSGREERAVESTRPRR
jgi:hypothetical protein